MNKSLKEQLEKLYCEDVKQLDKEGQKDWKDNGVSIDQLISFYDKVNSKPHPNAVWWNNPEYPESSDHPGNWTLHGIGASVEKLRRMADERERILKPTESPQNQSNDINPNQHTMNENKSLKRG